MHPWVDADALLRWLPPTGPPACLHPLFLAVAAADVDGSQPRQYRVHTLAGLIQPALLADGQVRWVWAGWWWGGGEGV